MGTGVPVLGETTISGGTGNYTYTITPTAFTEKEKESPLEKISKLDFTTTDGIRSVSASVFIRHVNYTLSTNVKTYYDSNGSTYTLNIKSNADWRIKSIERSSDKLLNIQTTDNLKVGTTGDANLSTGTDVRFTVIKEELSGIRGTVDVVFESTDNPKKFADKTITLKIIGGYYPKKHGGWAGSNIYWDGTKLTFDDVGVKTREKYQGVFFNWGSLWGIASAPNDGESLKWGHNVNLYAPGGVQTTYDNWATWPRVEEAITIYNVPEGKEHRDRAYLYEVTDLTGSTGIGDICRYLTEKGTNGLLHGKKWRMRPPMNLRTSK
ncbi:hypothetical protein [Bacteroides reticulotermitis]|uniref:hypothetical protein n=1 Tax=Bacteroides reticulotermitis TaxID=1133319 RepID=UPI0011DCFCEB|nr:hypothetical protein [Bacteroides reticulotermitis]